jgi:amino acid transporter
MSSTTLARRTLGTGSLWIFGVSASSPLVVLVGGVIPTYAAAGAVGVPVSFVLLAITLALLAVGYVAMSRHVVHAAPFYAVLARGLSGSAGTAGALVALLGYNCIQISLYALVGTTLAAELGGVWWGWAAAVWLLVVLLGRTRITTNARLIGSLLTIELAVIVLFDIAAFVHPGGDSISFAPLDPSQLFSNGTTGASAAFAFGMAAFVGFEAGPVYGEEARSAAAVRKATLVAVVFLGVFYALSAFSLAVAVGADDIVSAARDQDSGLPFSLLGESYGPSVVTMATILLITSIIAAMAAFHHTCARYVFGLARERVLPPRLARLSSGTRGGTPLGGSAVQSVTALVVVAAFAVTGADPMRYMFTWLSTIGALAVMSLLLLSALAVYRFFRAGRGANEGWFVRIAAPWSGFALGMVILLFMVSNLTTLLGLEDGSPLRLLAPAVVVVTYIAGAVWGSWLRRNRREIYTAMGTGTPEPIAVLDQRLAALDV